MTQTKLSWYTQMDLDIIAKNVPIQQYAIMTALLKTDKAAK
jgi:hypothetical protein